MPRRWIALLLVIGSVGLAPAAAAQVAPDIQTPARGDELRTAILDALRENVRDVRGLERDVLFRVHKLAVLDDYAMATVSPISPIGDPIYEFENSLDCDRQIYALVQFREDGWTVAERDVGPCDYSWPIYFEQNPDYPDALLRYWEQMDAVY
ncbi:MAG: hypothetical protein AAF170_13425 [Bacteroidota bacterium]